MKGSLGDFDSNTPLVIEVKPIDKQGDSVLSEIGGIDKLKGTISVALHGGQPHQIGADGLEISYVITGKDSFNLHARKGEGLSQPFAEVIAPGFMSDPSCISKMMDALNRPKSKRSLEPATP